jgi:hypothetical protein
MTAKLRVKDDLRQHPLPPLSEEQEERRKDFLFMLAAFSPTAMTRILNDATPTQDWSGCPKEDMAQAYACQLYGLTGDLPMLVQSIAGHFQHRAAIRLAERQRGHDARAQRPTQG